MRISAWAVAGAALLGMWLGSASGAHASTIMTFIATDFDSDPSGVTPPYDQMTAKFTLDIDPAATYDNEAGHVTSYSFTSHSSGAAPAFGYSAPAAGLILSYDPSSGILIQTPDGGSLTRGADDFLLIYTFNSPFQVFSYTTSSVAHNEFISETVTQTPIPGSVLMLLTALAGLGGFTVLRNRTGKTASAPLAAG